MRTSQRDLRRQLFKLAAEQAGYFTAAQARTIGYSYQAQAHHVGAGNWWRIDRGLFRLAEWPPDMRDDLARWTVWSKGQGVVSHETALSVHGIGEFESPRVHLTVPTGFSMRNDSVTLHPTELREDEIEDRGAFRVTTPPRSIVDVAAEGPDEDQLARAIDEAQGRGLVTPRQLRARSEAIDPRAALYIERAIVRAANT